MLNKDINELNAKKLLVSSQVTAIVTIIELSFNILYVLVVAIIMQKTSFGTVIQAMVLYFVILPYSFLMNTSYNRNRIVDLGWKNILKNIFGCPTNSVATSNNDFIMGNTNKKNGRNKNSETKDNSGTKNKISKKRNKTNTNGDTDSVFVISKSVKQVNEAGLEVSSTNGLVLDLNNTEDPSTSYGIKSQSKHYRLRTIQVSTNDCEEDLCEDKERYAFVQHILCNMISNMEDECLYLQYFKVLLNIEKYFKNGKCTSEYNILNLSNNTPKIGNSHKGKKGKTKAHRSGVILSIGNDYWINSGGKQDQDNNNFNTPSFKGDKRVRAKKRGAILNKIVASYNIEEYTVLFEQLIDLEESFVQEL